MVLLTCWACLLIAPELYRVPQDLSSLGLSVNSDGVIVDVVSPFLRPDQSPASRAGLVPGERIDMRTMRCFDPGSAACASLLVVMGDLGELEYTLPGKQARFDILAPNLPPRSVTLLAEPAPLAWADRMILLAGTMVGLIFVAIAFILVWRLPSRMSWGFFLYAIWFNPGQDYTFYACLQSWPVLLLAEQLLEAALVGAANAGLLIFALRFPSNRIAPSWRKVERCIPWLGAGFAACVAAGGLNLFGVPTEKLNEAIFFSGFIIDAAAIAILLLRLPGLHPQDEQRMLWAIAGCVIGIPAFLTAELFQSTSLPLTLLGFAPPQSVPGLLYLLQGVMAYFVGTAMYRRRVVSIAIPLRRGATLTFLTFLLGVPILYLHERISLYAEHKDLPSWLWPLVVGPAVLVILAQLQDRAAALTERIFNRRYHRARQILSKASLTIQGATSFVEIDHLLTHAPAAALRLASVAIFRLVGDELQRVGPSIGWTDAQLNVLDPAQYPAFLAQLHEEKPVQLPRRDWNRPDLPSDDLFPCLAVPMRGGVTESIAIIFCGPHLSGADISFDERELLRGFASRAALSYDRVEANKLRREIQELRSALAQHQPRESPLP